MNNKKYLYELSIGTHIISADDTIWTIIYHSYPYTILESGLAIDWADTMSEVEKTKGGYIIL